LSALAGLADTDWFRDYYDETKWFLTQEAVTFPSLCGSFQIVSERERREDKCVLVLCVVLFDVKIEVVTSRWWPRVSFFLLSHWINKQQPSFLHLHH
jgi:hypothetical protein